MSSTRREFLTATLGASALWSCDSMVPDFLGRSAAHADESRRGAGERALVVVQLTGGNDGLNTVIPFGDDHYGRNRRTLRMTADRILRIDEHFGFHPQMMALRRLWDDGRLGIVQGVGYADSSRDHGVALRDWHTACPGDAACRTGWVGRTIDREHERAASHAPGVFVGDIEPPLGVHSAKAVVPRVRSLQDCVLRSTSATVDAAAVDSDATDDSANESLLEYVERSTRTARECSRRVDAVIAKRDARRAAGYPAFRLAKTLATVADLVRADLGIRIYFVELGGGGIGGFDSHANQAGNHGALLRQLSESVAAFVDDLARDRLLERVLLVTFSEFGRTLAENGRRGTDHGAAAPMFLAGGALRGGLTGAHPSLADLDGDAPKVHTDFRRLYATMLDRWLGIESAPILGGAYQPLDLLRA